MKALVFLILLASSTCYSQTSLNIFEFDANGNGLIEQQGFPKTPDDQGYPLLSEFQNAIDSAQKGNHTLFIPDGVYSVNQNNFLRITDSLTIEGESKSGVIISLNRPQNNIVVSGSNIEIRNVTFKTDKTEEGQLDKLRFFKLEDIDGFSLKNVDMIANDVYFNTWAFDFNSDNQIHPIAKNITIDSCRFENFRYVFLKSSTYETDQENISITNSVFYNNFSHLNFNSPDDNSYMRNIIIKNNLFDDDHNLVQKFGGINYDGCIASNTCLPNRIVKPGDHSGISIAGHCSNIEIDSNTFINFEKEAIHIEDFSNDIDIRNNVITDCAWNDWASIIIYHDSYDINISDNVINQPAILSSRGGIGGNGSGILIITGLPYPNNSIANSLGVPLEQLIQEFNTKKPYNIQIEQNTFNLNSEENIGLRVFQGRENINGSNNLFKFNGNVKSASAIVVDDGSFGGDNFTLNIKNGLILHKPSAYFNGSIEATNKKYVMDYARGSLILKTN